ncbi:FAD-dependent oxidoreductase [Microbacterium sp. ARD32]|uniref:flavin monoamine oxidase family protein n=1 Tax=Microbacterium sp. ARD32 TaxID=2962577 RepID=UPI002881C71E|nr:FAD-dependent oxidoreductase [Microbacterium sp. ARD32]MDT0156094.1 FAD-dependent oxidoreductase [Microbacterium sp. ARD32]
MSITRRTLLLGAGTGVAAVLLAACTPETPTPKPTRTRTPGPRPTAPSKVPAPSAWARSAWTKDPYSFGAVSYLPAGAEPQQRETLAEPVDDRLFFAGEALDADHPGTVLGAVDSGRSAALSLINAAGEKERVAVIGAGAAGVVAARMLADANHDVTIFEARERTGGRIVAQTADDWPIPAQLGAWLITDEQLTALHDRLTVLGEEQVLLETATGWSEEGATGTVSGEALAQAVDKAKGLPADVVLAEALTQNGADPDDPALAASLAWLAAISGADPAKASSWYPPAFPDDALAGMAEDLGSFFDDHLKDLQVTLASPVVRVAYDDSGVSLRLGTGEALSFDRAVVTVPLGVLQQQGIEFAPALPFSHRGAIAGLASGFIESVWLRFDEPFWDAEQEIWHVVGGDGLIRTWLNLLPATGEPVLVGLVGGADAEQFAELSERDAKVAARAALAFFAATPSDES